MGYDPVYGARPLKRAIQKEIENPLATKILENAFGEGDTVRIELIDHKLVFTKQTTELNTQLNTELNTELSTAPSGVISLPETAIPEVAVEETLQQVNGQYPDPDSEPVLLTED